MSTVIQQLLVLFRTAGDSGLGCPLSGCPAKFWRLWSRRGRAVTRATRLVTVSQSQWPAAVSEAGHSERISGTGSLAGLLLVRNDSLIHCQSTVTDSTTVVTLSTCPCSWCCTVRGSKFIVPYGLLLLRRQVQFLERSNHTADCDCPTLCFARGTQDLE